MKYKSLLVFLSGILFSSCILAQQSAPCATDEFYRRDVVKDPGLLKIEQRANEQANATITSPFMNKKATVRIIPVVFHIIHHAGFENISQAQIMDQLRILNEDYRKKAGTNGENSDPAGADVELEFRLAQYDPSGNKHDGINRIYSPAKDTNVSNATGFKALSYWNSSKYMNVWIVSSIESESVQGTVLGYAQFPFQLASQPTTDGVVVRSDQIGVIGTGQTTQGGRTLTHEGGHWLGLYHTFQGGCVGATPANCANQGDQVCDTPPVADASFGCNTSRNSCTNDVPDKQDMTRNYMDYSDGTCLNTFTEGQKARINNFMALRTGIFGGSPSFIQSLTYAGLNNDGSYIVPAASSIKAPYSYGFEDGAPANAKWRINNFNTPFNGWQVNNSVSYSGTRSFYIRNIINNIVPVNSRDGFQTPEIDLSTAANPTLEFYYAYAQKSTSTIDSFTVKISNTFGMEEIMVFGKRGDALATAGVTPGEFIPVRQDWKKVSIDLTAYKTFKNARLRFEFVNRRGNNIYFDELTVRNGPTGVDEQLKAEINFKVYPNPMNDLATVTFELKERAQLEISIVDLMGKEVYSATENNFAAGSHELNISKNNMKSGMYFIRVNAGRSGFSHKLLIN